MARKSVTIKAAWIGGAFLVIGALIGVVPRLFVSPGTNTTITAGGQQDGSIVVTGESGDITIINNNVAPTETNEAIEAIERKLERTNADVRLSREELRLLANALRDFDQRTSGIEKLPDGRTRLGTIITGSPTIVIDEHNTAVKLFKNGDFTGAFEHSQQAIDAHETSQREASVQTNMNTSDRAMMYYVGTMSAHRLKRHEVAYKWAEKANGIKSNMDRIALLAATLFNVGRHDEALQVADRGLKEDPNDPRLATLRAELAKRIRREQMNPRVAQ